jgi:indolepyruvate ferredoxin oxidoreductase alpha subunit
LSVKQLDDPLRDDPVAAIDTSCVGCGNCGEVADAAILCPSFYQADLVQNPSRIHTLVYGIRRRVISALQLRRARNRLEFSDEAAS